MRCDQPMGITEEAEKFLKEHRQPLRQCVCCGQSISNREVLVYGEYEGMFGEQYPLHIYKLKGGLVAEEYLQDTVWSSGPCFFLGLRVYEDKHYGPKDKSRYEKIFLHNRKVIEEC